MKGFVFNPLLLLDPSNLNNLKPISKLPFVSKVLEKLVAEQLLQVGNSILMNFNLASAKNTLLKLLC